MGARQLAALASFAALATADPTMAAMMEEMPMRVIAGFGIPGLDPEALDTLLADAAAR